MSHYDFPNRWKSLLPKIADTLTNSSDFNALYASLVALKALVSVFSLSADQHRRAQVCSLIAVTFSPMQALASKLIHNYNQKTGTILLLTLKIFSTATFMELPANLKASPQSLHIWLIFIKTLLDCNLPIDETLLKIRKKSLKILQRFIQRHANPKYDPEYSNYFLNRYGVKLLESIVLQLLAPVDPAWKTKLGVPAMTTFPYLHKYHPPCKDLLEHHKQKLISVVIQGALLGESDLVLWQQDPMEFIYKEKENRKPVVDLIRMYADGSTMVASQLVEAFKANSPVQTKQILLFLFSELSNEMLRTVETEKLIEVLRHFILPGLADPSNLIKSRCCEVYDAYKELDLSEQDIQLASQNIYACFVTDCLPIQIRAAEAFAGLIEKYDSVANTLKAHVGDILNRYVKLIESVDSDTLVQGLESIIAKLKDNVEPFAIHLISSLSTLFFRYCEKEGHVIDPNQQEEQEDEEVQQCASNACLATIRQILSCPLPVQCYLSLSVEVYNLVLFILAEKSSNYLEEGLNILNLFLFKSPNIPDPYLHLFPLLCYYVTGVPEGLASSNPLEQRAFALIRQEVDKNIVQEIIGPLRNFVSKLKHQLFVLRDLTNKSYYQLMTDCIHATKNRKELGKLAVLETLYLTVLEHNQPETLNQELPIILSFALTQIKECATQDFKKLRLINIEIILVALYVSPASVLTLLNSQNLTLNFIEIIFQDPSIFKADYEKQRLVLGLLRVLEADPSLTKTISGYFSNILSGIVQICSDIIVLRQADDAEVSDCSEAQVDDTHAFNPLNNGNKVDEESDDVDIDDWEDDYNKLYYSPMDSVDEVLCVANYLKGPGAHYVGLLSVAQQQALSQAVQKATTTCKKNQ